MAVTLDEAKNNAQEDLDTTVIDEFRKGSVILDTLIFDDAVNPSGGGATLEYAYRRLVSQPTAAFRAYNTEYTPQNVTTQKYSTELVPLGGAFEVDRVLARVGAAASGAVSLNMAQKIKAAQTRFQDAVINGDTAGGGADDAQGFDGLDKALVGSSTEYQVGAVTDWTDLDTDTRAAHKALDALDEFFDLLDGTPTIVLGNTKAIAKFRAIVRRSGQYVKDPVEDLIGQNGRPIMRESYGGTTFANPGERAGSTTAIIPIEGRTIGGIAETGLTDLYAYRVGIDGFHGVTTTDGQLVRTWLPDFSSAGAVKKGEVELGPVSVALKATKAAAVWRNIKVQ
ncbi:major capsid protein [Nocardiopsis synnemataformans]|uniref:major capsid protein n=1 Tax=Nocardiopsis synnemataformans TaxID=61305 RepID=UPI003EBB53CD